MGIVFWLSSENIERDAVYNARTAIEEHDDTKFIFNYNLLIILKNGKIDDIDIDPFICKASRNRNIYLVKFIVSKSPDEIDAMSADGKTVLVHAIDNGDFEMITFLVARNVSQSDLYIETLETPKISLVKYVRLTRKSDAGKILALLRKEKS